MIEIIKNLFVFIFLLVSGCILVVEDTNNSYSNASVWLDNAYAVCFYDAYWDLSEWNIEIHADSYYGVQEVAEVGYYINNYDYTYMSYIGNGWWKNSFYSNYYDCGRDLHFDFVAFDYEDHRASYTMYW